MPALRSCTVLLGGAATPSMLQGMRVVELAGVLAGPSVGQYLGELGADVIKVENVRTGGDVTRTWRLPGEGAGDGRSAYFHAANMAKRSVAVDATHPEGYAVVEKLIRSADVALVSYKPGDAERLRLDYATLSAQNPRLVYGCITGYGPDVKRAGYDAAIQAESGFQYINGEPGTPPTKLPVALMDVLAAHQLKQGILLALWQRDRTQAGSEVHVSLMRSAVSALANQATSYLQAGVVPQQMGSDHPSICPYGTVFTTRDGKQLSLAVGADSQYRQLCAELGMPVAEDHATNPLRVANRESCKAAIAACVAQRDRGELLAALAARAVPCGAVNSMDDVFSQPQAQALAVRQPDSTFVGLRQAVAEFSPPQCAEGGGGGGGPLLAPPLYGEHTREVLRSLGYTEEEVVRLCKARAVDASDLPAAV